MVDQDQQDVVLFVTARTNIGMAFKKTTIILLIFFVIAFQKPKISMVYFLLYALVIHYI
jgi:hypothetical protein